MVSRFVSGFSAAFVCVLYFVIASSAQAQDAPSNADLFKMIKALQTQQSNLVNQVTQAKAEAEAAKAEAARAKSELAAARQQIANTQNDVARVDAAVADVRVAATTAAPIESTPGTSLMEPRARGAFAGSELTYLKPFGAERSVLAPTFNAAHVKQANPAADQFTLTEYDYEAAARLWLGYESATGKGVQATYWEYDQDADLSAPFIKTGLGAEFDTYTPTVGNLRAMALDLELTKLAQFDGWDMTLSGGLRYAEFDQSEEFQLLSDGGTPLTVGMFDRREFRGLGPTGSLSARRRLGNSNLSLVSKTRGALLYGHGKRDTNIRGNDLDAVVVPNNEERLISSEDSLLFTLEQKLSLEWERILANGAAITLGVGVEGQLWGGTGDIGSPVNNDGNQTRLFNNPSDNTGFAGFNLFGAYKKALGGQ